MNKQAKERLLAFLRRQPMWFAVYETHEPGAPHTLLHAYRLMLAPGSSLVQARAAFRAQVAEAAMSHFVRAILVDLNTHDVVDTLGDDLE